MLDRDYIYIASNEQNTFLLIFFFPKWLNNIQFIFNNYKTLDK